MKILATVLVALCLELSSCEHQWPTTCRRAWESLKGVEHRLTEFKFYTQNKLMFKNPRTAKELHEQLTKTRNYYEEIVRSAEFQKSLANCPLPLMNRYAKKIGQELDETIREVANAYQNTETIAPYTKTTAHQSEDNSMNIDEIKAIADKMFTRKQERDDRISNKKQKYDQDEFFKACLKRLQETHKRVKEFLQAELAKIENGAFVLKSNSVPFLNKAIESLDKLYETEAKQLADYVRRMFEKFDYDGKNKENSTDKENSVSDERERTGEHKETSEESEVSGEDDGSGDGEDGGSGSGSGIGIPPGDVDAEAGDDDNDDGSYEDNEIATNEINGVRYLTGYRTKASGIKGSGIVQESLLKRKRRDTHGAKNLKHQGRTKDQKRPRIENKLEGYGVPEEFLKKDRWFPAYIMHMNNLKQKNSETGKN